MRYAVRGATPPHAAPAPRSCCRGAPVLHMRGDGAVSSGMPHSYCRWAGAVGDVGASGAGC